MKKYYNISGIILAFVFIGGIILSILKINSLPANLFHSLASSNLITEIYIIFGCGVLALVFNQIARKSPVEKNIVYVDKITKNKDVEDIQQQSRTSSSEDFNGFLESLNSSSYGIPLTVSDGEKVLNILCNQLKAGQGIIYKMYKEEEKYVLKGWVTYAYLKEKSDDLTFEIGEGLPGLVAKENKYLGLDNIPQGYIKILSGLGQASPEFLILLPLRNDDEVVGVLEIAVFWKPDATLEQFFQKLSEALGKMLGNSETTTL